MLYRRLSTRAQYRRISRLAANSFLADCLDGDSETGAQKNFGESTHYAKNSVVDRIEVGMTVETEHGPMKILDIYIDMDEVVLEIERVVPSGETIKRPMLWTELKRYLEDY